MTIDEIKKLIQNGEKIDVEFKESRNALTKDVFDTVCSFNNRNGGHILLGVNDKRDIDVSFIRPVPYSSIMPAYLISFRHSDINDFFTVKFKTPKFLLKKI